MRTLDFAPLLRSSIGFENLNRLVDFATRGDRLARQQPCDDVHQPRRHAQRLAREADAIDRAQRVAIGAAVDVEITARLVGEQHRFHVERVDQPAAQWILGACDHAAGSATATGGEERPAWRNRPSLAHP